MASFHRTIASYCRVALRGKKISIFFNDSSNINTNMFSKCRLLEQVSCLLIHRFFPVSLSLALPVFCLFHSHALVDHGDMMEMQGFGGSPLSWQQGECTSHMSSCLSCSTGGSNASVELPAGCTCMHDR